MTIGEKMKLKRKELNLTQKQLADKAGISLMSIQRYERGERQPTVEILEKICDVFDISVANFMGIIDTVRPESEIDLYNSALNNIPFEKFLLGKTALNNKIKTDMLASIENIAKVSNISIEKVLTPETDEIATSSIDFYPIETPVLGASEFDGIIVTYKDKKFKISAEEYYKLADRIIESVAVNILAAETYKKE